MKTFNYEINMQSKHGPAGEVTSVRSTDAYPVGALVVHRPVDGGPQRWVITHGASSIGLCSTRLFRDAMRAARSIDAALDWGISEQDCRKVWERVFSDRDFARKLWTDVKSCTDVPLTGYRV